MDALGRHLNRVPATFRHAVWLVSVPICRTLPAIVLLWMCAAALYAASVEMRLSGTPQPNSITVEFPPVEGTWWYDFYQGPAGKETFVQRLEASKMQALTNGDLTWTLGGNESPIYSMTAYRIVAAARTADGNTLASGALTATSGTWSGVYKWTNPTDKDNDGKVREIVLTVKPGPAVAGIPMYYEIYTDFASVGDPVLRKVFPMFPLDVTSYDWVSYKDSSDVATAYRLNAEKFNKTTMKPKSWKLQSITVAPDEYTTKIISKALGFEVTTTSTYSFEIDAQGKRVIKFLNIGSGMAAIGLFPNPEDPDKPYTLVEV